MTTYKEDIAVLQNEISHVKEAQEALNIDTKEIKVLVIETNQELKNHVVWEATRYADLEKTYATKKEVNVLKNKFENQEVAKKARLNMLGWFKSGLTIVGSVLGTLLLLKQLGVL